MREAIIWSLEYFVVFPEMDYTILSQVFSGISSILNFHSFGVPLLMPVTLPLGSTSYASRSMMASATKVCAQFLDHSHMT